MYPYNIVVLDDPGRDAVHDDVGGHLSAELVFD